MTTQLRFNGESPYDEMSTVRGTITDDDGRELRLGEEVGLVGSVRKVEGDDGTEAWVTITIPEDDGVEVMPASYARREFHLSLSGEDGEPLNLSGQVWWESDSRSYRAVTSDGHGRGSGSVHAVAITRALANWADSADLAS